MTDRIFNKFSDFIYSNYGIKMPISKKVMLQARLQKRLKATGISNFEQYCDYVFSEEGIKKEMVNMINVVSTNKTDFFREPAHFDFLRDEFLPNFVDSCSGRPLKIWSAAASTGEEAYSIAIAIEEFNNGEKHFDYSIFCTDISTDVLEVARLGVYKSERITEIPVATRQKYFLRSKNPEIDTVRVIPEIRKKLKFRRLNLMDKSYPVQQNFDVIFCRNVLIYFNKEVQQLVIHRLCDRLKPDGYFLLGHSESITGMDVPLKSARPTIYRKASTHEQYS